MIKSIAQHFCEEVAAFLFLRSHKFVIPEVISVDGMRARYIVQAMEVREDDRRRPRQLIFADGTSAVRNNDDLNRWDVL